MSAQTCPNCHSPIMIEGGRCAFCHAPLSVGTSTFAPPAAPHGAPAPVMAPVMGGFSMQVEDVFEIRGRGTVATGKIATGTLRVGDNVLIDGPKGQIATTCKGIEMFRKTLDTASAGDNVGLLLDRVDRTKVTKGCWLRAG